MEVWQLFAQVEALSGVSGWAGTGLLGAVLSWVLLVHLPNKDKQSKEKDETHDNRMDGQRKEFTDSLTGIATTFKTEAIAERVACEKHFATLADTMNKAFDTLGRQLSEHSTRNQQWLETLKQEVATRKAELAAAKKSPDG